MKAETLRKYYGAPTLDRSLPIPSFVWHPKKRGWPKTSYRLSYSPSGRMWFGSTHIRISRLTKNPSATGPLNPPDVEILKAALKPEQIAMCAAASIEATKRPQGDAVVTVSHVQYTRVINLKISAGGHTFTSPPTNRGVP
ncbi:hypothetical protein J2X65_003527 [Ancylobacter sp. 3268]|uniref:hypothetical protein n=1 Tax=Ancylobacter sp. 3268 TaxID=2817752 RepID=UPI0028673D6A|nr:hypothetical protein [Ancylobacter sp. 3268]MDR6954159.1 hypothetical protein [Ancylobacter sp. 3268]